MGLEDFVIESWKIERISLDSFQLKRFTDFHDQWMYGDVSVDSLTEAALLFTNGDGHLRDRIGMNVRVGNHLPPPGGPEVKQRLRELCDGPSEPYTRHLHFENLHPFMDGNGRTGRLLWLRDMVATGQNWQLGFLHTFYYQTLSSSGK